VPHDDLKCKQRFTIRIRPFGNRIWFDLSPRNLLKI